MENYHDDKIYESICNIPLSKLQLDDGQVSLRVRADKEWVNFKLPLTELHAFIAGLTVYPEFIGNGIDAVLKIEVQTEDGLVSLLWYDEEHNLHHAVELHAPYVLWTNDGGYDDPELDTIQAMVNFNEKARASEELHQRLMTEPYVLAMDIDYFTTLFKRHLPLAFIKGLEAFGRICQVYETYLAELPEEVEKRLSEK